MGGDGIVWGEMLANSRMVACGELLTDCTVKAAQYRLLCYIHVHTSMQISYPARSHAVTTVNQDLLKRPCYVVCRSRCEAFGLAHTERPALRLMHT